MLRSKDHGMIELGLKLLSQQGISERIMSSVSSYEDCAFWTVEEEIILAAEKLKTFYVKKQCFEEAAFYRDMQREPFKGLIKLKHG